MYVIKEFAPSPPIKYTVGFGQDFGHVDLKIASDTEGVRARATARWKRLDIYIKNNLTPKIVIQYNWMFAHTCRENNDTLVKKIFGVRQKWKFKYQIFLFRRRFFIW